MSGFEKDNGMIGEVIDFKTNPCCIFVHIGCSFEGSLSLSDIGFPNTGFLPEWPLYSDQRELC